jgi:uncharacterized protein YggU (UPF0235/DUF167 family)
MRPASSREPKRPLLLAARVIPRSSRDEIAREGDGLRVHVTAPPASGAAHDALVALLARRLKVPSWAVAIVRAAAAREEIVTVCGLNSDELWQRMSLRAHRASNAPN